MICVELFEEPGSGVMSGLCCLEQAVKSMCVEGVIADGDHIVSLDGPKTKLFSGGVKYRAE